jgi:hypothetical protein
MYIIFQVNGGIGKCIASTAVCEAIRKHHPDRRLVVVSGYPEVYLNNPNVYRSFAFERMTYFFSEFVDNKDAIVFAHDPYMETSHIYNRISLSETWCRMFGIPYSGEQPKMYITDKEMDFYGSRYKSDKPIMVMQTNGGPKSDRSYSWARDLPTCVVKKVIDRFKSDYNIVHLKREDQVGYDDTIPLQDNLRSICALLRMSVKRLFMDSFAQHASAGLGMKSAVCWIVNEPQVFGYDMHRNIRSNPFTKEPDLRSSYLNKFNITGHPQEFPYESESDIFNVDEIIDAISNQ